MKIGVISDTHGRLDAWKKAEKVFACADLIVHAGDVLYHPPRLGWAEDYDIPAMAEAINRFPIPIVIARGNCDPEVYEELLEMPVQSPYAFVEFNGLRIVVNHGHLLTRDQMIALGKRFRAHVFVSGHTHMPVLERVDGLILLNPGSPAYPKFEQDGKPIGTVGLITDTSVQIVRVEDAKTISDLRFEISD